MTETAMLVFSVCSNVPWRRHFNLEQGEETRPRLALPPNFKQHRRLHLPSVKPVQAILLSAPTVHLAAYTVGQVRRQHLGKHLTLCMHFQAYFRSDVMWRK